MHAPGVGEEGEVELVGGHELSAGVGFRVLCAAVRAVTHIVVGLGKRLNKAWELSP